MKLFERITKVTKVEAKNSGFGSDATLVGIRINTNQYEDDGRYWSDTISIPLGVFTASDVEIGRKLRITVETVDDDE